MPAPVVVQVIIWINKTKASGRKPWFDIFFKQDQGQSKESAKPRLIYSNKPAKGLKFVLFLEKKTKASARFRLVCLNQT